MSERGTKLLAFGPLRDVLADESVIRLRLPATAGEVREQIVGMYPELAEQRFRLAVDQRMVDAHDRVEAAAEVALLPPFAGG